MKCKECKGCLDKVQVGNEIYFYCFLCKKIYKLLPGYVLKKLNVNYEEWINDIKKRI